MSLPHLLLGLLREPASGYELKQAFDQGLRHLWSARLSQIYPTLQRLEEDGCVRSRPEPSAKGPVRRVYRRTAKGRRELHGWLDEDTGIAPERIAYLARLSLMGELENLQRTRAYVLQLRAAFVERRRVLEGVESLWFRSARGFPDDMEPDLFHGHLTVRAGLQRLQSAIAWCDECLERISRRESA